MERKSVDLWWKGLRVEEKKIVCRSGREQNRFPRVSRDRNKARIRVIVEHVSSSVSRTSVHTDVYPPPFRIEPHHETSGDSTRERVWALLGAGRACPTIGGSDRRGCFASLEIAPFVSNTF